MTDLQGIDTAALLGEIMARSAAQPTAPVEIVVRHIQQLEPEARDSLEIGTPGKGGTLKVYFDAAATPQEINARIDRAFEARSYAQLKLQLNNGA